MRAAVLSILLAASALAQEFSPPPLVQAEPEPGPPAQVLQPPSISNPPLEPGVVPTAAPAPGAVAAPQARPPPGTVQAAEVPSNNPRLLRAGVSLLLGAAVGTATAVAGGFIGGEYLRPGVTPVGNIMTGGAIGFALGVPVGVLISGALLRGNAPWYAAIVGDLVGAALGAVAVAFGGPEALPAAFSLPLFGAVIGSEVASDDEARVTPTAVILPNGRGGALGLSGRF
ncbi:MAG: hypothetical protein INH41_29350 [Myxococcaceae bacterium]|nr:hypothetical protein [Myxococcaceae bacterium]